MLSPVADRCHTMTRSISTSERPRSSLTVMDDLSCRRLRSADTAGSLILLAAEPRQRGSDATSDSRCGAPVAPAPRPGVDCARTARS